MSPRACGVLALTLLGLVGAPALASADALARGDAAWAARAGPEGAARPDAARVEEAIALYGSALAADPARLDVRWRLLRALYFAAYFASDSPAGARERFDRARSLADEGVALLAEGLGGAPPHELGAAARRAQLARAGLAPRDVARFYFWSAIHWGGWARSAGLVAAVRQGVANRLHDYATVAVELEPDYEGGAAHRLLARLHAELPRVPLLSGWVDRSRALPEAERALEIAPADPGNRLLLALTLLDLDADGRRDEALALLEELTALEPRPEFAVEDAAVRDAAARRLAQERERLATREAAPATGG
jgi:tetratricopeptide (TPR) repeat protein